MARQEVASMPMAQDELSIALLRSGQCLDNVSYTVADDAAQFFLGIFGDVLRNELHHLLQEQMPALLELVERGELQVTSVQYTQLKKCKILDEHRPPTPDGTFHCFSVKKIRTSMHGKSREDERGIRVVMGPDGSIYEHQTKLQSKYSFVLDCKAGACTLNFRYTGTRAGVTFTQPCDPRIVSIAIESKNPWMDRLAHAGFWPFMMTAAPREQSQDAQSSTGSSRSEMSKYEFEQSDGCLFLVGKKDRTKIANFYITQILAVYTSVTTPPIYKVLCLCGADSEEIVAMLEPSRYRYSTDVFAAFQQIDADLFTIDIGPAMLAAYLLSIPNKPAKSKLITYWGVQTDGVVILGNRAFDTSSGELMSIDETTWAVWDKTFIDDKVNAYKLEDFPRIVPMPLHCKYTVGYKLFNEISSEMFLNNYWPAVTVLAWQIVAMFYPYMQKGEFGGGAGNPVLYITGNHGTGKSSAAKMAAALTGHFGPLASGQTTMAAMLRKASMSTLPTHYEDPKFTEHEASWTQRFGSTVRTFFDGSERMVCGKTDTPRSSFAISTNEPMPCSDDTALWSRVIYVRFTDLEGEQPATGLYNDFTNAIALHSALMPEYFTLVRPGGFDLCAINDFTAFLDEVTCKSRERNNSGWARVGYTMVLLTKLYQGSYEKMHELLEFVAKSCHYQATRMLSSPGLFEKFLSIVLETIARGQSVLYDSDQCVYFHCYRTTITVGDKPVLCLRLDWWAKYLKSKKLLEATAVQLRDARPREHSEMRSDVPFYSVSNSPWPPTYDGKPYTEAQMEEAALTESKPCLVISEAFINSFERAKVATMQDINLVLVDSHRADIGSYPFVQSICSGDWFGFDTLDSHKLAPFFKTNTALMDELDSDIVREHAEQQLPRVEYCTSIGYMSKVFKVNGYSADELEPCLQKAHFKFKYLDIELTSPTTSPKRLCTALRARGGARHRAPPRSPGNNTLPARPTSTPIAVHREKENASPNPRTLSETEVDHNAEVLASFDGLAEIDAVNLFDILDDECGITADDMAAAAAFDDYSEW